MNTNLNMRLHDSEGVIFQEVDEVHDPDAVVLVRVVKHGLPEERREVETSLVVMHPVRYHGG